MPRKPAGGQTKKVRSLKRESAKQACQKGGETVKRLGNGTRLSMVRDLIEKWSQELAKKTTKSGVAELIRLLALEKELSASNQAIREIKVSWVEPETTESSKSE